jgi:Na+/phosphate symporter
MKPFCMKMVKSTIKEREETNLVHKDLMQYLIQLRNNSVSKTEADEWKINAAGKFLPRPSPNFR